LADATLLTRKYLLQDAALLTLVGDATHIVGGELPEYSDPNSQACWITIATEGGKSHPEAPINADRVKVRVWAGLQDYRTARQVYGEIQRWLHRKNQIDLSPDGFIIIAQETSGANDMTDPDAGWATVFAYYEITNRDSIDSESISITPPPPSGSDVGVGAGPVGSGGAGR
jgi:hypothetical protein